MGGFRWGLAALLAAGGFSGCQCSCLFDHYADEIDYIATDEGHFDVLYCPCLDLTRIGRPDWCQCGFNRVLCPCACARRKPFPDVVEPTPAYFRGAPVRSTDSPHAPPDLPAQPAEDIDQGVEGEGAEEEPYDSPPTFEMRPAWPNIEPPPAETDPGQ